MLGTKRVRDVSFVSWVLWELSVARCEPEVTKVAHGQRQEMPHLQEMLSFSPAWQWTKPFFQYPRYTPVKLKTNVGVGMQDFTAHFLNNHVLLHKYRFHKKPIKFYGYVYWEKIASFFLYCIFDLLLRRHLCIIFKTNCSCVRFAYIRRQREISRTYEKLIQNLLLLYQVLFLII